MPQLLILLVSFVSFGAAAQECKPEYKVQYNECAASGNPKVATNLITKWILVNEGARKVQDSLCTEYIPTLQKQHPDAKNIRIEKMEDRDASFRGLGKRDVYCKFQMEDMVTAITASPSCGVKSAGTDCIQGLTRETVENCVKQPVDIFEDRWTKAACLIDVLKNAPQIQGMDSELYSTAKFQLQILRESLAMGRSPQESNLLRWIRSQ